MSAVEHPRVREYLGEFDAAATGLALPRRRALRQEIRSHLIEAIPAGLPDEDAVRKIAEFGPVASILEQEQDSSLEQEQDPPPASTSGVAATRHGWSRWGLRAIVIGVPVIAAAIILTIVLASIGSAPTSIVNAHPRGVARVTSGDAYFDYLDATKAIGKPLPPGASYPAGVPVGLNQGATAAGVQEFGGGSDVAHFTWLCAWETDYLHDVKTRDVASRVTDERMLTWWGESAWWSKADPDHGWNSNVVAPMRMGNSAGVSADVSDSCQNAGIDESQ